MNYFASFLGFINKDVEEENETKTIPVMLRFVAVVMCIYYLIFTVFLLHEKILIPAILAILCFAVYLVSFYMTYHSKTQAAVLLTHFFLLLWGIIAIAYFGWSTGTQQFFAALLILEFVTSYSDMRLKWAYGVLLLLLRLSLYFHSLENSPISELSETGSLLMTVLNTVAFYSIIVIVVMNFTKNSLNMENKLKSYNEKLVKLASVDPLTGLKNRRCMMQFLEERMKQVGNMNEEPTTIAIGDIDFFKRFNDQYGHACGDEVLKQLSAVFMDYMEGKGEVARWGGEEFLLVFTNANLNQAIVLMDKLLHKIRLMEVHYGGEALRVTMTFGVAQIEEKQTIDSTISFADKKLYIGKQNGRNRVVYSLERGLL